MYSNSNNKYEGVFMRCIPIYRYRSCSVNYCFFLKMWVIGCNNFLEQSLHMIRKGYTKVVPQNSVRNT